MDPHQYDQYQRDYKSPTLQRQDQTQNNYPQPIQQEYYLSEATSSIQPPPYNSLYEPHSYQKPPQRAQSTRSSYSSSSTEALPTNTLNNPQSTQEPLSPTNQTLLSTLLRFTTTIPSPPTHYTPLPTPILIPQISPSRSSPFLLASSPSLPLPPRILPTLLQNLNILSSPNPAMSSLNNIGSLIGLIPHHIAQAASAGIQASATLGSIMINKTRVSRYLSELNRIVFEPRRMRIRILSGREIMVLFGIGREEEMIGEGEGFLEGVLNGVVRRFGGEIEVWRDGGGGEGVEAELELGFLDRMSRRQVAAKKEKIEKQETKRRGKEIRMEEKRESKKEERDRKRERKHAKRERKGKAREESDDSSKDGEEDFGSTSYAGPIGVSQKTQRRYAKQAKKILFVVIENA